MTDQIMMKVVLMGNIPEKTMIRKKFLGRGFRRRHLMTIGADFAYLERVIDNRTVCFRIWDLAGQDSFRSVRSKLYRGSMGGLIFYDINKSRSFMSVTGWIEEFWKNNRRGVVPVVIVGVNAENRDENSVSSEKAQKYVEAISKRTMDLGFEVFHFEVSAKTGSNVDKAIDELGRQIIAAMKAGTIKLA